jgi:predicted dehydrogenase
MLHLGLVGCAHIHTPGFVNMLSKRDDVKVTLVWDPDRRRSDERGADLSAKVVDSSDAIFADDAIEGVIVCSETNRHEALVGAATRAGKHLFVEKPLGMGGRDGYRMAEAIEAAGVHFQTGYFQRSDPKHRFLKTQIDGGTFGTITRVRGSNAHAGALGDWFRSKPDAFHEDWRWMADPTIAGVGAFGDLGAHALDILLWWFGEVTLATAQIDPVTNTYDGTDESGEGLMRFASGTLGTLSAGWVDVADPVKYLVSGTEGHAAVINGQLHLVSKKDTRFDGSQPVRTNELPAPAPHAFELFLDALVGKELPVPLVTAREAAYRSAVMEAMYEGARSNSWVTPKSPATRP